MKASSGISKFLRHLEVACSSHAPGIVIGSQVIDPTTDKTSLFIFSFLVFLFVFILVFLLFFSAKNIQPPPFLDLGDAKQRTNTKMEITAKK